MLAEAERVGIGRARRLVAPSVDGVSAPVDRTDVEFVTLDPAASDRPRPGVRDRRSPATTSCCTTPSPTSAGSSSPATRSTRRRGGAASRSTCPTGGPSLHPPRLSEDAGSLLPDVDRPAIVFTVRVARPAVRLDGAERVDDPQPGQARLLDRHHRRSPGRIRRASPDASNAPRSTRGAERVECAGAGGRRGRSTGSTLRFRPRSEIGGAERGDVARHQHGDRRRAVAARHRPVPHDGRRRRAAHSVACATRRVPSVSTGRRSSRSTTSTERCPPTTRPAPAAFHARGASTRRTGRRSTTPYDARACVPWHAAVAATYVHATAPLRRLADRYVIEAVLRGRQRSAGAR